MRIVTVIVDILCDAVCPIWQSIGRGGIQLLFMEPLIKFGRAGLRFKKIQICHALWVRGANRR